MGATDLSAPTADQAAPVITRFAPSPTGFLHIGGARTALFNLLFARHHGGKFLLRIEDTDRVRSTQSAIDAILDGMRWLNLDWDGDVVFQFARAARHAAVAETLLAAGHAYRCYATPAELEAMRAEQRAARQPLRYDGRWRDRTDAPADTPFVIRIKAPRDGETVIADRVQGEVTVANAELDDYVLLRTDGTPTYMLSVVVDDHDMGVTHVIRGDDHLNNAFRQLVVVRAMAAVEGGWPEPVYAHAPLIHGADGAKLSKRHGALGVDAYRDELGILPEALENYLVRLGWGHGDDEIISRRQAITWFDIAAVGRSPSRFDAKKLDNLNGHYLRDADDTRLAAIVAPLLAPLSSPQHATLIAAMPELKLRARSTHDIADAAGFLFATRPLAIDTAAQAHLSADALPVLRAARDALGAVTDWTAATCEEAVRAVAEAAGMKLGKVAQPLRAALTGRTTSPGIFDVLALLGRAEVLGRLDDVIAVGASPTITDEGVNHGR